MLKEENRQAIIVLYNYDVVTGQYVDKELQKEKMIKEIAVKWEGKYSEETIKKYQGSCINLIYPSIT